MKESIETGGGSGHVVESADRAARIAELRALTGLRDQIASITEAGISEAESDQRLFAFIGNLDSLTELEWAASDGGRVELQRMRVEAELKKAALLSATRRADRCFDLLDQALFVAVQSPECEDLIARIRQERSDLFRRDREEMGIGRDGPQSPGI